MTEKLRSARRFCEPLAKTQAHLSPRAGALVGLLSAKILLVFANISGDFNE